MNQKRHIWSRIYVQKVTYMHTIYVPQEIDVCRKRTYTRVLIAYIRALMHIYVH